MNDAHDHEMQVKSGKTNTRGVTGTSFSTIGGEGDIHESTSSGGFHLP